MRHVSQDIKSPDFAQRLLTSADSGIVTGILVDAVDGELPGLGDEGVEASAIVGGRARDVADDVPGHGRVVQVLPPDLTS